MTSRSIKSLWVWSIVSSKHIVLSTHSYKYEVHEHGIVHGNLTSVRSNFSFQLNSILLVIPQGNIIIEGGKPQLGDFGMSIDCKIGLGSDRQSSLSYNLLHCRYQAPEVMEHAARPSHATAESDVFSLGRILYDVRRDLHFSVWMSTV